MSNIRELEERSKYRNPSPPPGYIRPNPHIRLKPQMEEMFKHFPFLEKENYGVVLACKESMERIQLLIDSGILEDEDPSSDYSFSDDDVDFKAQEEKREDRLEEKMKTEEKISEKDESDAVVKRKFEEIAEKKAVESSPKKKAKLEESEKDEKKDV